MKNRNFKGVWIPKEVYLDNNLSWTEKILLVEIDSLDNEEGCFASNNYFSDFIGISPTSISTCISKLVKLGYIKNTGFNGRTRTLVSLLKYQKPSFEKSEGRLMKNHKHINTDSNSSTVVTVIVKVIVIIIIIIIHV